MHKTCTVVALALSTTGLIAAPNVTDVNLSQQGSRAVITYNLSESAIVTVDIQTNGVSVGHEKLKYVSGAVNKLVEAGTQLKIRWDSVAAFPEQVLESVTAKVTAWVRGETPDYLVATLAGDKDVRYYCHADEIPGSLSDAVYKTEKLVMRRIHARNVPFRMGNRPKARPDTAYAAVMTNDYWIGVYELTQRQHELVMGSKRGCATTLTATDADLRPVEAISYSYAVDGQHDESRRNYESFGANSLFRKFRARTDLKTLAFPTEAQWEFACRAGSGRDYPGDGLADPESEEDIAEQVGRYAWYEGNSDGHTHAVGGKDPNAFGLYDMIGNAREIVYDWYDELKQYNTYSGIVVDPFVAARDQGYGWVLRRGAGFADAVSNCKMSSRYGGNWAVPDLNSATEREIMQSGIRLAAVIW